jgi:hypothetical protein
MEVVDFLLALPPSPLSPVQPYRSQMLLTCPRVSFITTYHFLHVYTYFNKNIKMYLYFLGKKLARGISRATDNVNLVSKARSEFALEFRENALCNVNQYFIETPIYTFTLPDLTIYPGKQIKFKVV